MPDSQDPKQANNNDLRNAQFGGGFINAENVHAERIGGDIYNIHLGQQVDEQTQALVELVQKQHLKPIGIPENIPRSGVVEFVGRDAVMPQLHQMLQQDHHVAVSAIIGMGGVGKTELALQYAVKYQQSYPGGICWLSARGLNVGNQIVQFGRSLLNLNPAKENELMEQVQFCWQHWRSGEVLLILDDVTDYAAIKSYLPPSTDSRFKVLITTRLRLGLSIKQLELQVLEESTALKLLNLLVGSERIQLEQDCAQQLCIELGYLPLGLELIGRYLARKQDISLVEMLQRLRDKRLAARALCQTEDDMTAQLGVASAFDLSWDILSEGAKTLGYLVSLFAPTSFSWLLVEQFLADQDPEDLEDIRDSELLDLHLLKRTNSHNYRQHTLIRDFFQTKSFAYQMVDYSKTFEQLWKLRERLKREGHWMFLKNISEKLLPMVDDSKKVSCLILLGEIYIEFGDLEQAEHYIQSAVPMAQSQGNKTDTELCILQLQLINNLRRTDILDEMSFIKKAEYKRLYPNPSEFTGFNFLEFLEDSNRQLAASYADTHRQMLEYQWKAYRNFITEHGESELANNTFLPMIGETLIKLGDTEINAGNLDAAREALLEALKIVDNYGMMKSIALTNYHLARLERFLDNTDLAQTYYTRTCNILQSLGALRELKRIQQEWQRIKDG